MSRVHVIGAGMAGLAAALALVDAGHDVIVYEAGPAAGGRCRSYHDKELDCRIDNGNHLWLSGNRAIAGFLRRVGSEGTLAGPARSMFPFYDAATGEHWTVEPNAGPIPWWVLAPRRRVPGARLREYAGLLALLRAGPDATVADVMPHGALNDRLIEPLVIAALNTAPATGSAALMAAVMRETLMRGGSACIPAFPKDGLSATFIDPALAVLRDAGATIHVGRRISALAVEGGRVATLAAPHGPVTLDVGDGIVLAVPAAVAQSLLPGLTAPEAFESIVNLHYRHDMAPGPVGFVGLLGTTAEWVFVKPGVVSVTISAANRLIDRPASDLAATVWPELCAALGIAKPMPAWRVVKEKRATFAATPAENRKRPGARIGLANLALAGDWTDTGLPATIEGAIRSGQTAAAALESVV
ncbi:hydroxysqualene dehydroxylase HpnE [Acidisphaera sp. L21]|uniref:hydroxysqualene dehydroxylase HpnE n=1 Tax=Acidisphaera sp. L21 TaxID=1641851 RepID=UPI00131E1CFB|nr:hydroxysqualene dehydroxylase HpnE [Acidisphaera sp. L21]